MDETVTFGKWRIHTLRFALSATLLVAGLFALGEGRGPFGWGLDELIHPSFLLGGVLFFLGAWVAPQAVEPSGEA